MKKIVLTYFMLTLLFFTFSMFCSITPSQAEYSPFAIQELTVPPRSNPIQNHKVDVILITQQFSPCQECSTRQRHIVYNNEDCVLRDLNNNFVTNNPKNDVSNYMQNLTNPQLIIRVGRMIKTLYCNQLI